MSESKTKSKGKKEVAQGDVFQLTPPPDAPPVDPADQEPIRVNLFVTKGLHKRLRKYAIDHEDKSLVGTIQDILEDYLKAQNY